MVGLKSSTKLLSVFLLMTGIALIVFWAFPNVNAADPTGATLNNGTPERAPDDTVESTTAWSGNVTDFSIVGFSITQSWQGYFGNVSGTIQLADAGDNVLYNWTLANPEGEVYASVNSSITWTSIQCFNFSAAQTYNGESDSGGTTNINGTNLTTLETQYNITFDDVDGVDETFNFTQIGGSDQHDGFFTANREFGQGECLSTRPYSSTGQSVANQFEEVLLYEPVSTSVIFASLLEEGSVSGFDAGDYDFEMIVLEDGHGTNIATTTYYFFVEIE